MKKVFLILCCLSVAASAWAQIGEQGQWYLGMNLIAGDTLGQGMIFGSSGIAIGVEKTYEDGVATSDIFRANINMLTEAGYFVADGLAIGPMLAFRFYDWHDNESSSSYGRASELVPGIQALYIFRLPGIIQPYAQLGGAFLWMRIKYDEKDYFGYKVLSVAGVKLRAAEKTTVDLGLFYSFASMTLSGSDPLERTDLGYGGLRVGLSLYL